MIVNANQCPMLHPQVAARAVAGQMLIVLADWGEVMVLNDSGTRLWAWIDGRRSAGEIASVLAETFGLEAKQAQAETGDFLQALLDVQAIELGETPQKVG